MLSFAGLGIGLFVALGQLEIFHGNRVISKQINFVISLHLLAWLVIPACRKEMSYTFWSRGSYPSMAIDGDGYRYVIGGGEERGGECKCQGSHD